MSEERPTNESPANPEMPTWAQATQEAPMEQRESWERTPPPPPGAELEPGEQSNSTIQREQRTGEVSDYNEQGISATDAEMGAQGWTPGSPDRRRAGGFLQQWQAIQAQFVDDPRAAVQQADQFFEELTRKLEQERKDLRSQWDRGENASTEDLRVAMQRYRDYFQNRLG